MAETLYAFLYLMHSHDPPITLSAVSSLWYIFGRNAHHTAPHYGIVSGLLFTST
jgi:hypothetical protein